MDPYNVLYERKCKSLICLDEVREARMLGPEVVQEMTEQVKLIRAKMTTAQCTQKNYANM